MGIWKVFFDFLVSAGHITRNFPPARAQKVKGKAYGPGDAIMPLKIRHVFGMEEGVVEKLSDLVVGVKQKEEVEATVKLEECDADDLHLRDLASDDPSMAAVGETLFFVMPNTSGLVAGYKVRRSCSPFFLGKYSDPLFYV